MSTNPLSIDVCVAPMVEGNRDSLRALLAGNHPGSTRSL